MYFESDAFVTQYYFPFLYAKLNSSTSSLLHAFVEIGLRSSDSAGVKYLGRLVSLAILHNY